MANEITVSVGMSLINGGLRSTVTSEALRFDQTTARGGGPGSVTVGTTEETIGFGDITPGFVHFKNLDDTNFVELGFSAGVYGPKLRPGGVAIFELTAGATVYAKADTADCDVQVTAFNE